MMHPQIFLGIESIDRSMYIMANRDEPLKYSKANTVIITVSKFYGEQIHNVLSKSQKKEFVSVRYISMYFILKYCKLSLKRVGKIFKKDHTTIMHARDSIKDRMYVDKAFKKEVINLDGIIRKTLFN